MRKKKILIIDHDESDREALRGLFPPDDFDLVEAADAESGWPTFEKEQPELIILDVQLPRGHGFDLCQKIIQASRLNRVPIIIVTAFGTESDTLLKKLSVLDIDFIFPKPAPPKELLQTVSRLLDTIQEPALPPPLQPKAKPPEPNVAVEAELQVIEKDVGKPQDVRASFPPPVGPRLQPTISTPDSDSADIVPLPAKPAISATRRLILADDNPITRQIVQRAFSRENFEITVLANGPEVLDCVEKIKPDVILLDINLPGKNGYEVCEFIRNKPALKETAVIFLKEQYEKVDQQRLKSLSWDDLIRIPARSSEWVDRVKKILAKKA
ncbi:MAG: response regulator [Candidatus Aminicenantales bacterium]